MAEKEIKPSDAPSKAPKVGDEVNYVAPGGKITKAKVSSVNEEHKGRLIKVKVEEKSKNADGDVVTATREVPAVHRPEEHAGGNTWHWPVIVAALLLSLFTAKAGIPTYRTFSAYGNAAGPATVVMPADPSSQIRIVTAAYRSDTNNAFLNLSSGGTALSVTTSNSMYAGTVTNIINTTNGLSPAATLVLMHWANGIGYTNAVVSWNNTGTNIMPAGLLTNLVNGVTGPAGAMATNVSYVVTTTAFSPAPSISDELYVMGAVTSWPIGTGTNWLNGDDLFSGNYGRPVLVQLLPALVTNGLPSISAHYDSASQP
ncbi:MAG TPA: hypothetical protein VF988_03665 [Verrucomicrobiae bacterium]